MKRLLLVLFVILALFVLFSFTPFILMLVWNYVIAQIFTVPLISFWQMFCITTALELIAYIFKNSSSK